jgi:DNA-binding MarR family transcriptional regulator
MNDGCKGSPVQLVLQMADQLRHHLELATRKVGITAPQAKLLVELADPRRMSDLAEHQSCDPSSITSLVDRLERDGFVRRVADPEDGRARLVTITAGGRKVRDRFLAELEGLPDPFATLTAEQRSALVDRLRAVDAVP